MGTANQSSSLSQPAGPNCAFLPHQTVGRYKSAIKPAAQRKKDKERKDGALRSSFEPLDSALPEAVRSMSGPSLARATWGWGSVVSNPQLPAPHRLLCSPESEQVATAQGKGPVCSVSWCVRAGRRADEQSGGGKAEEGEGAGGGTQDGAAGGTGWGTAGSGGSGELTPRCRGWHTPAPRLSRDPAGKRSLRSHPQRVMSRCATSTQTLSSFSLFNVGPLLGIYLCFVQTNKKNYLFISGCIRS